MLLDDRRQEKGAWIMRGALRIAASASLALAVVAGVGLVDKIVGNVAATVRAVEHQGEY